MDIEATIIKMARDICAAGFMDYPDYDADLPMDLSEAITIIIQEYTDDDELTLDETYETVNKLLTKEL